MVIEGANQKIVAAGLFIPISLFFNNNCVKPHLNPPKKEAERTRMRPGREKDVVVNTMRRTPAVMSAMTAISRKEGRSRCKRKAKRSTNMSEEDLHIV